MPWSRDRDPLEAMRRELAEKERLISRQMSRLTEELHHSGENPAEVKIPEPPLWRLEEEIPARRATDPAPARRRHLARQRQRDKLLFFLCMTVLLIVLVIVLWIAYVRNTAPNNGA